MQKRHKKLTACAVAAMLGLSCMVYPVHAQEVQSGGQVDTGGLQEVDETAAPVEESTELSDTKPEATPTPETGETVTVPEEQTEGEDDKEEIISEPVEMEQETQPEATEQTKVEAEPQEQTETVNMLSSARASAVSYRYYENGTWKTDWVTDYTIVTSGMDTTWGSGWYVVDSNVTIDNRVIVNGEVRLILKDNYQLTAKKGIQVEDSVDGTTTSKLSIYGQSESETMGKLIANSEDKDAAIGSSSYHTNYKCGTITINGGHIEAHPGSCAAGIGGGGNTASGGYITINGGKVIATAIGSMGDPAAIGGGGWNHVRGGCVDAIVINGGIISAMGCNKGIGNGAWKSNGSITINGGTITANGVGAGNNGSTMTTTINGGTVICESGSVNKDNQNDWTGIVIEGKSGKVYAANDDKTFSVDTSFEISGDYTLTIPNETTWTIPDGVTITNNGTIVIENGGAINGVENIINNGIIRGLPAPTPTVEIEKTTASSITVTELENKDTYGGAEYSLDGHNWQTGNVLTDLHSNTAYTVYARYKGNNNGYAESDAGKIENVSTNTASYTITIPAVTLEAGKEDDKASIAVDSTKTFDLGYNGHVDVTIKNDGNVSNDGKLTLKRTGANDIITSALFVNNTALENINKSVATFKTKTDTPVTVSFAKPTETNIPAGTYNGTITFEVSYSEQ